MSEVTMNVIMLDDQENIDPENETVKAWSIEDDSTAEWALQKIAKAKADYENWRDFYQHKIDHEAAKAARTVDFMSTKLRDYFAKVPHHTTKTQESYELPSGKLVLKAQQPEYVKKEDVLIDWARRTGRTGYIKTVEKVSFDWSAMKKDLSDQFSISDEGFVVDKQTGEILDGLEVNFRDPKFVIE